MVCMRYSDLVQELFALCQDLDQELMMELNYYHVSVYKTESVTKINQRVDQLRAIFQVLNDPDLNEAMADHDAIRDHSVGHSDQMVAHGECTVTSRIIILRTEMNPALQAIVRRYGQSQSPVKSETLKILSRHRHTLIGVCREGSRSRELLIAMNRSP